MARVDAYVDRILVPLRKRWISLVAGFIVITGFIASWRANGLPLSTSHIFFWLTLGMLAVGIRRIGTFSRGLLRDWAPLFVALFSYDYLRGYVARVNGTVHWEPQLAVDRWLGGGEPVVTRLQHALWIGHPRALDYAVFAVHLSHFFVPLGIAAVLWVRNRLLYRYYTSRLVALFLSACATYALYPAAPPWMAGQTGRMDDVIRITTATAFSTGDFGAAPDTFQLHGEGLYNPVAALPSLHAAIPLLLLILFWSRAPIWLRPALVAYPLAMGFSLVYSGEHYVFDVLMGWAYAVLIVAIANKVLPRVRSAWATRMHNREGTALEQEAHAPALEAADR